ncbi:MAG TPA: hypothetical protein VIX20_02160 [Ktedonobacteraceae bacterium]
MRQGDGTDLLGPSDPRSASIGVIYVAPNDDRQSVLTAILTQDKLGFKQVIVVLPDQNIAFQRPVDFDGLKNMRRGLKAEIVIIAPSGPGPAEYARQRRFPVYSSLEAFSQSIRLETKASGTANVSSKRRLFGFGRKQGTTATVAVASMSTSRAGEEKASSLPVNGALSAPQNSYSSKPDQEIEGSSEINGKNGQIAKAAGLAAGGGLVALASDQNTSPTSGHVDEDSHAQSELDAGSQVNEYATSNSTLVNGNRESTLANSNGSQNQADPGPEIITFSSTTPRPKITRKFPVPPAEVVAVPIVASELSSQRNGSTTTITNKRSNTGKMAAVGVGAVAVGAGATKAGGAVGGSGGQPPSGSAPGGSGVGGTSRGTRIVLAILLGVLTVLLIGGITVAALPGGFNNLPHVIPGTTATATVTITPDSKDESNIFQIVGVTGTPNPSMREVSARIISSTSPSQSKTVQSTGSIPGTRATGALTFLNSGSTKTFGSVILRGASGVPITFNGPITVDALPGFLTITGFAVNIGSAGNIGALDITGPCCAAGITVKNGAFGGGQNPQPNSVVQQSDINGAASALTTSLTPGTQAALQKQVHTNEQVVPNTLRCTSAVSANHAAGDHAPNVTVIVSVTCKEEVYDQQAALAMAANLLAKQASTELGSNYALTGNIVTEVTKVTVVDTKGTLAILVRAEGVWVYQFSNSVLQGFTNHIANMSNQDATTYLMSQPGVMAVKIDNPSGSTLPDAAHIKIVIVAIPGATGAPTPTPGGPTVGPTGAVTPPAKPTPTPTTGLGGS